MEPFKTIHSRVVLMPVNDIDTDQIIPARFLKVTDKKGLGNNLFADWRYESDGTPKPDFILNQPKSKGAQVLLAGDNFGCGSSREHAPWALTDFGFRVVISTSFADIFKNNSLKNGLLPVIVKPDTHRKLVDMFIEVPNAELTIDLEKQVVVLPDGEQVSFPVDGFSRNCLLQGTDELGYLLNLEPEIASYEKQNFGG
jgi:3-isopropylmalate/(R)-2-methylmalate dehydratase small subunit